MVKMVRMFWLNEIILLKVSALVLVRFEIHLCCLFVYFFHNVADLLRLVACLGVRR